MRDPNALLATLAQSSAAIVAIVGGFLVSRLVALSSEREGLRRQLESTRDRLLQATALYEEAHVYRFDNSVGTFTEWVLGEIVKAPAEADFEELLAENVPRGSSMEEMRPVLDEICTRVQAARSEVERLLRSYDGSDLDLDDLLGRGLEVSESDQEMYEFIVKEARNRLPPPPSVFGGLSPFSPLVFNGSNPSHPVTEMRRLDESIREEQQLAAECHMLKLEATRLAREVEGIGRPKGVVSAILILATYSVLGILLPLVVMAASPADLAGWQSGLMIAAFTAGLLAVLGYSLWYWRSLGQEA